MFTFISNIPIFRRLFYAFLLAAVIPGIVITILGIIFTYQQNARSLEVRTNVESVQAAANASAHLHDLNEHLTLAFQQQYESNGMAQQRVPDTLEAITKTQGEFDQAAQNYQKDYELDTSSKMSGIKNTLIGDNPGIPLIADQKTALATVEKKLWPEYLERLNRVVNSIKAKSAAGEVRKQLNDATEKHNELVAEWEKIEEYAKEASVKSAQVGPSQSGVIILATVIAFLSTIMVVITIGYIVNLTITRPLRLLATLTKRIAKGETAARAQIRGRDEIYMVATSMNNMLDNIVRLIQEAQTQRDSLQSQVEKLVSEVSGVGEGDLRIQAEVTADALGVLADSFNYMVEELGSLVVRVKIVANEVENSTSTILDRMTQLVESGDRQIGSISEAAVEVERMAALSRQVAERSQVLYDVARTARNDAQEGRGSVHQAIEGMSRINENVHTTSGKVQNLGERSREINEIVEVISSIAHQTNRLALDAAIQAAMAGENGKGFGAVAADIRRLAERAKEQTTIINRIVRSIREEIASVAISMQDTERETAGGTRLTQEAGGALEAIFGAVEHQAREIENINHMAMQQLQSSSAVVQIMHGVSESTQQSSISTRDASQNMERLARLVEQLRASVEAFKLRDNQSYYVPNTNTNINLEDMPDNAQTVSGVFRTVSATAQPAGVGAGMGMAGGAYGMQPLLPERTDATYPTYPPQNPPSGPWNWNNPSPQSDPGWYNEYPGGNGR